MRFRYTIKQIFLSNQNWWIFREQNKDNIRPAIDIAITKLLSCGHTIRGYHEYKCSDPLCSHIKRVHHTCKSKACSSCGKKATENWIAKQMQILPKVDWQHITFTMPSQLWNFFWKNRDLLNIIPKLAANCIKEITQKKQVIPGIFIAIHTFGHDLKHNVHIHLSTTLWGISANGEKWKKLYFQQNNLMKMWRYRIIKLFRKSNKQKTLNIPHAISKNLHQGFSFDHFLNQLYQIPWIVKCSKPTKNHYHSVNYLGRYLKRPPIAESKLRHYDGHEVTFRFLNRKTKQYENTRLSVHQLIAKFISHIPDKGFRMIRYYGFLALAIRGKLLPAVYQKIGQEAKVTKAPCYAQLIQKNFGFNPLQCLLCGKAMLLSTVSFGKVNAANLMTYQRPLALLQKC